MIAPLTPSMIDEYDSIYLEEILNISKSANKEARVYSSNEFWNDYITDMDYMTALYFLKHFVSGSLYATPLHLGPIMKNHIDSRKVLEQLVLEGVITTGGQLSIKDEQRSYLSFEFPIIDINRGVELLKSLYKKGLNVSAVLRRYDNEPEYDSDSDSDDEYFKYNNHYDVMRNIILFKSDELTIYDLDAPSLKVKLSRESVLVSHPATWCCLDGPNHQNLLFNRELMYPTEYVFRVRIFNQKWDMLQADEILLETIREMKTDSVEELTAQFEKTL